MYQKDCHRLRSLGLTGSCRTESITSWDQIHKSARFQQIGAVKLLKREQQVCVLAAGLSIGYDCCTDET
jgi:hypothetical protein